MTHRIFRQTVLYLCCFLIPVHASEKAPSFHDSGAQTVGGELIIEKSRDKRDQVFLNGKPILSGDSEHVSWFISTAHPKTGLATLVLLQFDTGVNSCRYLARVMEIQSNGSYQLSPEFGNCQSFEFPYLPGGERARRANSKLMNPKLINGEWWLGFPSPTKVGKMIWYVYKNGQIFKDGKKVEGPDENFR